MRRGWAVRAGAAAVAAAVAVAAGACGQGQPKSPQKAKPVQHQRPAQPTGARIGKTQRVKASHTRVAVTVSRVIDPLTNSGAVVDPGARAVGVMLQVRNIGDGVYDSSSKTDLSLFSKNGAAAASAYASQGECATPEVDFLRQLQPGSQGSGCVVFSLNKSDQVGTIRFSPEGNSKHAAVWSGAK